MEARNEDSRTRTEAGKDVVHAWLAPGQRHTITVGGVEIVIRLVERRGRRARVAVEAMPGQDDAPTQKLS